MTAVDVAPGTLAVYADLGCPWAFVALHRLHEARERLGLGGTLAIDIRVFPLEVVNGRPTPFSTLQNEIPAVAALVPDAGIEPWSADPTAWPVTTLPPMEAVEAAKAQGLDAAAELDLALRGALFSRSECISMRHVILDVADACPLVDAATLADAIDDGRARGAMLTAFRDAEAVVEGSPHVFLADGTSAHNPGIEFHWDKAHRRLVVDADDPGVHDDLLRRAAATALP